MRHTLIICVGLLLSANLLHAQTTDPTNKADLVVGTWLTDTKDSKIEFFRSGDTYSGRLIWADEMFEADGKTSKKDTRNPDPKLKDSALQNLTIVTHLAYNKGIWDNGKIYDPDSGKTYSCYLKIKDGKLAVRAYLGVSALGKTMLWERVN